MLVLSRKPGQSIVIGDNIVVTLVEIRSGKARIGVDAPKEVSVDRLEVSEAKKKEASQSDQTENTPPVTEDRPKRRKPRKPGRS